VIGSFGSSSKVATVAVDDSTNQMRPEDHEHVEDVIRQHSELTRDKYRAGRLEHGGDCWAKPGMLAHAIDESADLPVYLQTLRKQMLDLAADCDRQGLSIVGAQIRYLVYK
jgi:hypothetical protein